MLNWQNIRLHNRSQNNAFEEVVCQLARHDIPVHKEQFYRLGTPDGGVECYWELKDHTEVGWQAKYVFTVEELIPQVDDSIRTAITNHPELITYIVAIPFNLPDPHYKRNGKPVKSAKSKWEDKVSKWKSDFNAEGRFIDIILWDESYLIDLLSAPQNEGLRYYWFNGLEFTQAWFKEKLDSTIQDLGPRYTPELNIELDIADTFDLLLRNERPIKSIQKYYFEIKNAYNEMQRATKAQQKSDNFSSDIDLLFSTAGQFLDLLKMYDYSEMKALKIEEAVKCISQLENVHSDLWIKYEKEYAEREYRKSSIYQALNGLSDALNHGRELFTEQSRMLNYPFMLLQGEPGVGKSHLIADICTKLIHRGYPCAMLLGDHFFAVSDPREQIKQFFQFDGTFNSFLQLLNSIGQANGQRFLLAIDALNEGTGNTLWPRFLAGLEAEISRYPWIALVVSIRDDYFQDIIPPKSQETMIRVEHRGFEDVYDFVCDKFFEHYGIDFGLPVFNHEFTNPLFLKLFCESCKDVGYPHTLPSLPGVFKHFIQHINKKLHKPFRYDPSLNLVNTALETLAELLLQNNTHSISYAEYHQSLETLVTSTLGQRSTDEYFNYLDALIKEGVLRTYIHYRDSQKQVSFAYDRMRDYYLLIQKLDHKPKDCKITDYIKTSPYFERIWGDEGYRNENTINLLSIVLPEIYDIELVECSSGEKVPYFILKGLLKSFQWRNTVKKFSKIGEWLIDISNNRVENKIAIINELLHIAAIPGHPFNIDFIHRHFLCLESMSEIDDWWTPHINKQYEEYQNNIYKRLVKWCWNTERRADITSESRRLLGMTLAWFCCATNRALRDCATKGIGCLYIDHVDELPDLFDMMNEVNDIYLTERLYAGAYGAVMHSQNNPALKVLSDYFLKNVFYGEQIIPHILIRDYARNVIEYSIYQSNYTSQESEAIHVKIVPPYKSNMPELLPSNEDIKALEEKYKGLLGFDCICDSIDTGMGYGDFGRYVFKRYLNDFVGVEIGPLKNWCITRTLELGYNPEIHDTKNTPYTGRGSNRVERIGKKYQWMAFHELLARVSDNFLIKDENSWDDEKTISYSGPWYPNVRDIDPSMLIHAKKGYNYRQPAKAWYADFAYLPTDIESKQWVQRDFLETSKLIEMVDNQGVEWYSLCNYPFWNEYPADFKGAKSDINKSMHGYVYSFLTARESEPQVWKMVNSNRKRIRDAFNDINWYTVFDKEYYWAPAYLDSARLSPGLGWKKIKGNMSIIQTTQRFLWEEGYDFSKDDTIAYDIPTNFMFSGLKLRSKHIPAHYYINDQLVCFNPGICWEANHALLIRKDVLNEWLERNNLSIIWMVTIEKYVKGGLSTDIKLWADYHGAYHLSGDKLEGAIFKVEDSKI